MSTRSVVKLLPTGSALVVALLCSWAAVSYADNAGLKSCTGNRLSTGNCSDERLCALPDCFDSVESWSMPKCVSGVAADNCVTTNARNICAERYFCDYDPKDEACYSTPVPYATSSMYIPKNGPGCIVGPIPTGN